MRGAIVSSKRGSLFLQVEGGGSWSLISIKDALSDDKFKLRNIELAELLSSARLRMEAGIVGEVLAQSKYSNI